MACNCGRRANNLTPDSRFVARAYPATADDGVVVLQAQPECSTPYTGAYKQATIFIVGYDTPSETVFARRDRTRALAYAKETNLTFDQVVAGALCHDLMAELLEA